MAFAPILFILKFIIARFYAFFYLFHAKKRQVLLPLFILLLNKRLSIGNTNGLFVRGVSKG